MDPRPHHEDFVSTLDTLYKATSPALLPDTGAGSIQSVVMTYYHGLENAPFIHTGFNLWSFRRTQCAELVDFVLQRLWGLTREAPIAPVVLPEDGEAPGRMAKPSARPAHAPTAGAARRD